MAKKMDIDTLLKDTRSKSMAVTGARNFREAWNVLKTDSYFVGKDVLPDIIPFETDLKSHLLANQVRSSAYNRFDYAMLLDSGLEFLSRALSLRDDGQELSLRAVNDLLERWSADKDLELARLNFDNAESDIAAQGAYAESLRKIEATLMPHIKPSSGKMDDVRLMMDYAELQARRANVQSAMESLQLRQKSAGLALQRMELMNDALIKRNSEPGHALNYKQRIAVTKQAFLQNITEAYSRLLAASEGVSVIFPAVPSDPYNELTVPRFPNIVKGNISEIGFVDKLMSWARETLFTVERINSYSHEYRVLLSLKALADQKAGNKAVAVPGTGHYTLWLKQQDLPGLANLRILHADLHVVPRKIPLTDEADYRIKHATYSGNITLPEQGAVGAEVLTLPRFYFGDASVYGDEPSKALSSAAFRNANPLGEWNIVISTKSNSESTENPAPDVWLELIVAGTRRPG